MNRFLLYCVARHNAADMDFRGERPGLFIRAVIGAGQLAALVLIGAVVVGVADFAAWELGLI